MARLINAPHLADQPHEPYSDLFVLAGSKAWKAWDNGKGEEWLLLCSLVEGLESKQKPVILGEDQLSNISSTRIAKEDQQLVKIAQYGELKQEEITAICQNLAKNTSAIEVELIDAAAQVKEDLSSYIQHLRTDKKAADLATQLAPPEKLKENDGVNKKARALTKWLNMDLALNPKVWGSDNICIKEKKKFGGKKLDGAPVCGALAFLGGKFMQKWKMVGIGGKWSKIGFYFA